MQQPFGKYLMFKNRLEKVYRHLSKQAKKGGVGCFRIYDHDLPEFPFIIEIYGEKLYVSEYQRKHPLSDAEHEAWLKESKEIMAAVLGMSEESIFVKLRKRKENRHDQYQKVDEKKNEFVVEENGLRFIVNLSDYLDTGLFLDHRTTRSIVKEMSRDKKVLNLFCYTGSFSVYSAAGGAKAVVSVDLSKTYLNWAERNMALNFPAYPAHQTVHADVLHYLKSVSDKFDLIIMDPPTFSNSKRMEGVLDIQRDHVELINNCMEILNADGVLFFSTNYSKFEIDAGNITATKIKDITRQTTPFDFAGKLKRQCFQITK